MNVEQRQEVERKVVRQLIRKMKEAGWEILYINDGGEPDEDVRPTTEEEAMDAVFAVDEATIYFHKDLAPNRGKTHFALIVLGNDGWDCIADHSCGSTHVRDNFEQVMDAVQLWCDISEDC